MAAGGSCDNPRPPARIAADNRVRNSAAISSLPCPSLPPHHPKIPNGRHGRPSTGLGLKCLHDVPQAKEEMHQRIARLLTVQEERQRMRLPHVRSPARIFRSPPKRSSCLQKPQSEPPAQWCRCSRHSSSHAIDDDDSTCACPTGFSRLILSGQYCLPAEKADHSDSQCGIAIRV
jgi:hypothetical protein